jgi:hypothetical protein
MVVKDFEFVWMERVSARQTFDSDSAAVCLSVKHSLLSLVDIYSSSYIDTYSYERGEELGVLLV